MTPPENKTYVTYTGVFVAVRDQFVKTDLILNSHTEKYAKETNNFSIKPYIGKPVKFIQMYMTRTGALKVVVSPVSRPTTKFSVSIGCLSPSWSPSTSISSSFPRLLLASFPLSPDS